MILVDTSVWVDFFGGRPTREVAQLERFLDDEADICTCGVILAEVLQGIRDDKDYRRALSDFESFLFLPMERGTFVRASALHRLLRKKGVTVRKPVDCMIAAVAIENGAELLHNDRDFDSIESHCGLKVVGPAR